MAQPRWTLPVAGRMTPRKHLASTSTPTEVPWPREMTCGAFALGPSVSSIRVGLVHFDHRDAASVNEAALEPDVLTILSTKHLANSNNSVSAWMLLHNSGYFAIWNFPKMHYC